MKTFFKTALFLMFSLALGMNTANAQTEPQFTVKWDHCDVQVTNSDYKITYYIFLVGGGTTPVASGIEWTTQNQSEKLIIVSDWSCSENLDESYILYLKVELIHQGVVYCSGELRTSALKCSDFYDDQVFNVNMSY